MQNPSGTHSTSTRSSTLGRLGWLLLAALTIFAFVMRFWQLADVPPGLFYDEAFNGLDAYHLLDTPLWQWPLFFTGNHGREPLLIWLTGISHAFFGQSIWTIRFVPALCGALLTPALTWLAWEVAPHLGVRNRRTFALWSGSVVLALLWSQIFSRYGIRLSLFVLLETLLWAGLWKAWGRPATDDRRRTTPLATSTRPLPELLSYPVTRSAGHPSPGSLPAFLQGCRFTRTCRRGYCP